MMSTWYTQQADQRVGRKWDFHDNVQNPPVLAKVMVCLTHLELYSYVTRCPQPQVPDTRRLISKATTKDTTNSQRTGMVDSVQTLTTYLTSPGSLPGRCWEGVAPKPESWACHMPHDAPAMPCAITCASPSPSV